MNIMDIAQNSIRANAKLVSVTIDVDEARDMMTIVIEDDGDGMSEDVRKAVSDPFFTTRTTRKVGLGLPYYEMVSKMCEGEFELRSEQGSGTRVSAGFRISHIDRAPLGNTGQTLALLAGANPGVEFIFAFKRGGSGVGGDGDGGGGSGGGDSVGGGSGGDGENDSDGNGDSSFVFDTREIKAILDGVGIDTPEVVVYMEGYINENIQNIARGIIL